MRIFIVESYTIHVYSIYCFHFYGKIFLAGGTYIYDTKHKGLCGIPLCSKGGPLIPARQDWFYSPGLQGEMKNVASSELLFQICDHRYGRGTERSESWAWIRGGPVEGWLCSSSPPLDAPPCSQSTCWSPNPQYFRKVTEFGDRAFRR